MYFHVSGLQITPAQLGGQAHSRRRRLVYHAEVAFNELPGRRSCYHRLPTAALKFAHGTSRFARHVIGGEVAGCRHDELPRREALCHHAEAPGRAFTRCWFADLPPRFAAIAV